MDAEIMAAIGELSQKYSRAIDETHNAASRFEKQDWRRWALIDAADHIRFAQNRLREIVNRPQ